ncbi:major facilitator superfamily transporter protein [Cryomyces antarcticus]|uniref:GPI ethanolamine phosphate transferase 2 n=1 Tax=Cryomyces antarcticus TaxID=329879 RepID=A0ABR0M919_9PEZI|nr:major facilitator superfamily transporter protein [Cryomyces antarcticus]
MPRVKAITTGSVPTFLDVILNFMESDTTSSLANQDTWLAQMKAKKSGKMLMYGDDTWLKLFPETFDRADGTSSFFVSDFTEVDNNVTRHIPDELKNTDWNTMVLHYLGLDHIGHKAGPRSPNMLPKQKEMDGIVRLIYDAMVRESYLEDTLLVLCGDHGMNDGGNHGGSSPGETSPALVFVSPKLKGIGLGKESPTTPEKDLDYYTKVEQSDIVPTLAGLLGFPVPLNNVGVFIPELLQYWSKDVQKLYSGGGHDEKLQLLAENRQRLMDVVSAKHRDPKYFSHGALQDRCDWSNMDDDDLVCQDAKLKNIANDHSAMSDENLQELYIEWTIDWCRKAQRVMSNEATEYSVLLLGSGMLVATIAVLLSISTLPSQWFRSPTGLVFVAMTGTYSATMFASSYVEEEQQFWYWFAAAWVAFLTAKRYMSGLTDRLERQLMKSRRFQQVRRDRASPVKDATLALLLLVLLRTITRWNQSGQKHAGAPDIAHTLFSTYPILMWTMVTMTYTDLARKLIRHVFHRWTYQVAAAAAFGLSLLSLLFKLSFTSADAPELCPLAFRILAQMLNRGALKMVEGIHVLLALFLMTQVHVQNIPLFLGFNVLHRIFGQLVDGQPLLTTITMIILTHVSFFALENSNAISSIDLSNAYNGVSGYNALAVGMLLFLSNWAGPVWWTSAGMLMQLDCKERLENTAASKKEMGQDGGNLERGASTSTLGSRRAASSSAANHSSLSRVGNPGKGPLFTHLAVSTLFMSASMLAVMTACTVLRTHLFIWTVFSPKYLYSMAWCLAWHLGINVGLGSLLYAVGAAGS